MVEAKNQSSTSNRGFASMDQAKQREIARKGGESVPAAKRSFSRNPELAAEAGRKGGESVPAAKRSFSRNPELAAEAGRKGGQSVPDEKRSFSQDPALAAEAGRKGGQEGGASVATDHAAATGGKAKQGDSGPDDRD
jgi:uncharacterized protein